MTDDPKNQNGHVGSPSPEDGGSGVTKKKRQARSRVARSTPTVAAGELSGGFESQDASAFSSAQSTPRDMNRAATAALTTNDVAPKSTMSDGGLAKAGARVRPTNLMELIEAAYMTTSKFGLTVGDFEVLERSLAADDSFGAERSRILELAARDLTLRGLVNLLSPISLHAPRVSPLRDRISQLATAALWQHPLYKKMLAHPRTASGLPDVSAKRVWLVAPDTAKELGQTESQIKSLRANAVTVFALLRVTRGEWTLEEFVAELGDTLWGSRPESAKRSAVAAAILVGAGDHDLPTRLGVLHEIAAREAREAEKRLTTAVAASKINFNRASTAEAKIIALESEVAALHVDLSRLREQLGLTEVRLRTEEERGSVARSHHADDYEVLRTQIVRQLSKQSDLLADGLHALRNGSHAIAEEFVDRALMAIKREVESLKENGEHQ